MRRYLPALLPLVIGLGLALLLQYGPWSNPVLTLRADLGTVLLLLGLAATLAWGCAVAVAVRRDRRPIFVEAVTYRYRGHSIADPGHYRTKEEIEEWRRRDPITLFGNTLVSEGTLSKEDIETISGECVRIVDEAVAFADAQIGLLRTGFDVPDDRGIDQHG